MTEEGENMSEYPTHRNASPQAWRRLRKHLTDKELRDIAKDIAEILHVEEGTPRGIVGPIAFALSAYPWEDKRQA